MVIVRYAVGRIQYGRGNGAEFYKKCTDWYVVIVCTSKSRF